MSFNHIHSQRLWSSSKNKDKLQSNKPKLGMLRNNKDIMSFKDIKLSQTERKSSLEIKILKSPSSKREAESN